LLATKPAGNGVWSAETAQGPMQLVPFTAIDNQPYTTYVQCL
jgi:hypothetical protein